MVQELIPKEEKKSSFLSGFLLLLVILVLAGSLVGYFWLKLQVKETNEQVQKTQEDIVDIKKSGDKDTEEMVFDYAKKIDDFAFLLNQRREINPLFSFLEGLVHKKVSLSRLSLETEEEKTDAGIAEKWSCSLAGKTDNFKILAEQMLVLKDNESLIDPYITSFSLGEEGGIEFDITFTLDPEQFENE